MEIKALATDLDRILTGPSDLLDLFAVEAIRLLTAAGIPVVFVTSRDYAFAQTLSSFLGGSKVIVAELGSVIQNYGIRQPPHVLGDPTEIAHGLTVLRDALGDRLQVLSWPGRICSAAICKGDRFTVEEANAALRAAGVRTHLLDLGQIYILADTACNKGSGLMAVAQVLDISPEQVAAIGENDSDLAMFQVTGYRIAVGNASPAVQAQADFVCGANHGRGFCEAVDHLLRLSKAALEKRGMSQIASA